MMEKQTWLIIGASSDVGVSYIRHLADKGTDGLTIYAHCNSRVSRFDEIKKDHPGLDIKVLKADLKLKSDRERLMDEVSDIEPNRFVFLPAAGFEYTGREFSDAFFKSASCHEEDGIWKSGCNAYGIYYR